jgi:choline-sulfatase
MPQRVGRVASTLLLLVVLSFAESGCVGNNSREAQGTTEVAANRPNVILVLSDDHRWDAIGVAGTSGIVTPSLDGMARQGVFFRQAITSVSQCHPVRATLLSGLPSFRHGVYSTKSLAPDAAETLCQRPTVASLLREVGYRTVLVGKWHLPASPSACGFDDVRTWLPEGGSGYENPELVKGIDPSAANQGVLHEQAHEVVPGFTQEILADDAVSFLRSPDARDRPFLLWLGFTAPHFPYAPNPPRIQALYAGRSDADLRPTSLSPGAVPSDWRHYSEAVSHLDEQLGRVLAALRETQLDEHTVVIFMGDNGHMMGERGLGGDGSRSNVKQVPYEGSLRVPLLIQGPGWSRGVVSDLPASSLDLPPTLLALAGLTPPPEWPGSNLAAALSGKVAMEAAFAEWSDDDSENFRRDAFRAIRTPARKLIVWKDAGRPDELYDLVADPGEIVNLALSSQHEKEAVEFRARLRAWLERQGDPDIGWMDAKTPRPTTPE